jgi:O-acetyl-ADP-ribose deacetylase (regulator of RNase III)
VFGFPADRAARIAVDTLRSTRAQTVERVVLVAYDDATAAGYRALLGDG